MNDSYMDTDSFMYVYQDTDCFMYDSFLIYDLIIRHYQLIEMDKNLCEPFVMPEVISVFLYSSMLSTQLPCNQAQYVSLRINSHSITCTRLR